MMAEVRKKGCPAMRRGTRGIWGLLLAALAAAALLACACACAEEAGTDLVVLTTTDMHGKCWETNILTGEGVKQNMLRVSTAVREIRQAYGEENVLLVDNGDLFQGTPVSEVHLLREGGGQEAMALCLEEIGYDALVLGNHEFNFPWEKMSSVYRGLRESGVAVLAANVYNSAGENELGTYIIREISVNGHPHKIGLAGLENTDITRWDLPANYPGLVFAHPDNPEYDLGKEASRYMEQMRADGCEMFIVSYHGGMGNAGEQLAYRFNSDNQGLRILESTDCLDLLIVGHDHSTAYSNMWFRDGAGRQVTVVNGGGQNLTETVFRLEEDAEGNLVCGLKSSGNLDLSAFEPDRALEEKIRPFAEAADAMMDEPIGLLSGDWDGSEEFYTRQNDTLDLVSAAMIAAGTERMQAKYGESGLEALRQASGLDHLDVDVSCSTAVNGGYIAHSGTITTREIYRMYRFANELLVIPLYGRDLKAVMEENAAKRLAARVLNGKAYFFSKNSVYTNLIFGGISFRYDMSAPAGERVEIESFSNGRAFDPDALYLVALNNYILGNAGCGLRAYSADDALWSQAADDAGGTVHDCIRDYITGICAGGGSVSPDLFTWKWEMVWLEDPAALQEYAGETAAVLAEAPLDGHSYVIYHEAQGCTLTEQIANGKAKTADIPARGNFLTGALPEDALVFTVHTESGGTLMLTDRKGRYLSCGRGGLYLAEEPAEHSRSAWRPVQAEGGYYLVSAGAENEQALEYYDGYINTYRVNANGSYLFNFYEVNGGE